MSLIDALKIPQTNWPKLFQLLKGIFPNAPQIGPNTTMSPSTVEKLKANPQISALGTVAPANQATQGPAAWDTSANNAGLQRGAIR